ncbi:unnamed protein product, partial [Phaeothamnion confervicola]
GGGGGGRTVPFPHCEEFSIEKLVRAASARQRSAVLAGDRQTRQRRHRPESFPLSDGDELSPTHHRLNLAAVDGGGRTVLIGEGGGCRRSRRDGNEDDGGRGGNDGGSSGGCGRRRGGGGGGGGSGGGSAGGGGATAGSNGGADGGGRGGLTSGGTTSGCGLADAPRKYQKARHFQRGEGGQACLYGAEADAAPAALDAFRGGVGAIGGAESAASVPSERLRVPDGESTTMSVNGTWLLQAMERDSRNPYSTRSRVLRSNSGSCGGGGGESSSVGSSPLRRCRDGSGGNGSESSSGNCKSPLRHCVFWRGGSGVECAREGEKPSPLD